MSETLAPVIKKAALLPQPYQRHTLLLHLS